MHSLLDNSDRKPIGSTGETVSAIGIGTWGIRDYLRAEETLSMITSYGIDNIDTAEMYGEGLAEELVGRVVRRIGKENVFVTTKMLPGHLLSRYEVEKAAKASLRRLGMSQVDLFLIHWPNPSLTIEEQVRNFETVYEKGYTRYIGVSNFDEHQLEEAIYAAKGAEIVIDQVRYSVLSRGVERSLLPRAISLGVSIQAYTPLEHGAVARNKIVQEAARRVGKTPIQVALNYLIAHYRVIAIPKTEDPRHLEEIAGAMGWRLPLEIIKMLSRKA